MSGVELSALGPRYAERRPLGTTWVCTILAVDEGEVDHPILGVSGSELCLLGPRYGERRQLGATRVGTLRADEVYHSLVASPAQYARLRH